jgi:hypothetical protein
MLTGLLHAHSGLRFLVLLAGLASVVILIHGLVTKRSFGKADRIASSAFAGLLHLQVVLGITMVALGRYYPALIGHLVLMLAAATLAQTLMSLNRRKAVPTQLFPLIGVLGALGLITGGVLAIGRGLLTMTGL